MRRLEGPEIESYDVLSRELAERVRIVRVPVLFFGSNGMTIGRFVLLRTDDDRSGNRKLLAHELVHVRQWYEAGRCAFLRAYMGDYFRELRRSRCHRDAYLAIRAEREAYAEADAWAGRKQSSSLGSGCARCKQSAQ
ncbi:MAG: DUF4157 domain-containing protein [Acidimicrobiaceae bacterium]|nr:DUF4157 domain-containing protein [Acidimicrobiaceae bacterium]MXW62505.1 DUF4157 domain-containing protein [Acidimicrobiaceae bacterium]MXW75742.1 DUF4157 domain-containing protein [Acidimicrobiaceae bacterium]MYA73259.1 DUF4157 domain-containing protein [Acidimicrobiaceae bacterium]MYC43039.1 DUF4157 domain-containing protein [Acidimicrobiaceae bacterium]